MSSLRRLIALHDRAARAQPAGIGVAMGDPWLYAASPIFRSVRDAYVQRGFAYRKDHAHRYFGFKLFGLNDLIRAKTIPVWNNVQWFRDIERSRPGFYRADDFYVNFPVENHLLHESAHLIAFHAAFRSWRGFWAARRTRPALLRIMLIESFANTVEALSDLSERTAAASFFRRLNCYFHLTPRDRPVFHDLIATVGLECTVKITILAFLSANFLHANLPPAQARKLAELADVPTKVRARVVPRVQQVGTDVTSALPPMFRLKTNRLYLTMLGYDRDLEGHLRDDPMELMRRDAGAQALLATLAAIATG